MLLEKWEPISQKLGRHKPKEILYENIIALCQNLKERGQKDSTVGKAPALHKAGTGSIFTEKWFSFFSKKYFFQSQEEMNILYSSARSTSLAWQGHCRVAMTKHSHVDTSSRSFNKGTIITATRGMNNSFISSNKCSNVPNCLPKKAISELIF